MADWNEMLVRISKSSQVHDNLRNQLIDELASLTQRNVIVYYSGWLQKPHLIGIPDFSISDADMTGFSTCCNGMDTSKGVDLLLHTPGGDVAATESIISFLRSTFNSDIRAIVPQMAMSGGTLIALAARSIVMGNHSSLGPVDPQIGGRPAQGFLEEFERAWKEVKDEPEKIAIWRPILEKISPPFLTSCIHAVKLSDELLEKALSEGMFKRKRGKAAAIKKVKDVFGNQQNSRTHARHIDKAKAKSCGLVIESLEDKKDLQERVLSLHNLLLLTLQQTDSTKIIASSNRKASVLHHSEKR